MIPEAYVNTKRLLCRQEGECCGCLVPSEQRVWVPLWQNIILDSEYEESLIRDNDIDYVYYTEAI